MLDKTDFVDISQLRAIFFDLGMVLFTFDWGIATPRFASFNGGNQSSVQSFLAHQFHIDYELGLLSDQEFYQRAREHMGFRGSFDQFRDIWCNIFSEISGTAARARQLAAVLPAYVISNTNPLHIAFLEAREPLFQVFRRRFYSYQLGIRKPESRLYLAMLEQAGVDAPHALLVDDKLENVQGARAVGMQALYVPTPPLAEAKLALLLKQIQGYRDYESLA